MYRQLLLAMSHNKLSILVISLSTLFLTFASGTPLVSVGDFADVSFSGSSSARWTSNVFRDETNETEDRVLTVSPGFEVSFGRGLSNLDLVLLTSYDIVRYNDNEDLDTEMFHIRMIGGYRTSRWDVSVQLSFDELQSATGVANVTADLIESEDTRAKISGEYRLSPKFSFGSGIDFSKKEYIEPANQFANYDRLAIPLDLYYQLTPKVDLSVGYTHEVRELDPYTKPVDQLIEGYETTTHFLNVGARGVLLPKLTGFFKLGYRVRDSESTVGNPRDDSDGSLGLSSDLTWSATPKLTNKVKLDRDFNVSGEGTVTENSAVSVSSNYFLNSFWSFGSNLGYTLRSYQDSNDREDVQTSAGISVNYTPNKYWSFSGAYSYSDNDSDAVGNSYTDHMISLTAFLRY